MLGIIRFLFFNNRCPICDSYRWFSREKICEKCLKNLDMLSSVKEEKGRMYLWKINSWNYRVFRLFEKGRGNVFKSISKILLNKNKNLNLKDNKNFTPFHMIK